jgi:toxin FitB
VSGWLLGPEAFAAFIGGGTPNRVLDWAGTVTEGIYVSEMTWAEVRSQAQQLSPVQRQGWLRVLDEQVPTEFGPRLLPLKREHLSRWSEVRLEKNPAGSLISPVEAFDAAVCMSEQLGYVTRSDYLSKITRQPTHNPWS